MRLGLTILRLVVGGLFVGHGLQKLAGKFGGGGPEQTGESFEQLGLKPGKSHAVAAGVSEAGGGALIAAGALTPLGAAAITGTMATAIRTVHGPKGPWNAEGGYEFNLVLIATVFALTAAGPGPWSVDGARGRERWGTPWALAALGGGLAGSAAAVAYGQRQGEPTGDSVEEQPTGAPAPTAI